MLITNVKPGKLRDMMSEGLVIIFPLYHGRQTLLMCLLYQSNKDASHVMSSLVMKILQNYKWLQSKTCSLVVIDSQLLLSHVKQYI